MKLFLTLGRRACVVDEFARSVTVDARHRTVSEAVRLRSGPACMHKVGAWRPFSSGQEPR